MPKARAEFAAKNQRPPSPGGYLTILLRDDWGILVARLGLADDELVEQLDTGQVRPEHWPAILKAEKLALRRLDRTIERRDKMERRGIRVVEVD